MTKINKTIWRIIYSIGTFVTLLLSTVFLSHSNIIINPDAMLPFKLYEQSFLLLGFGSIPMLVACYMVYRAFEIKNSNFSKIKCFIIFIPGIIYSVCAIFIFGVLFVGMINSFIFK